MSKLDIYTNILADLRETYINKNSDYGDSFGKSIEKYGFISALTRMSDKFNRLESLILNGENLVKNESLEDTLLDLANYCIMTTIELKTESEPNYKEKVDTLEYELEGCNNALNSYNEQLTKYLEKINYDDLLIYELRKKIAKL